MKPTPHIAERYALEGVLGQGGCATVYRAHDEVLGVPRAIKVLSTAGAPRVAQRERLQAEAHAMARLNHPHILRIYDIIHDGDTDCIVMELASRGSLSDQLDREGPLGVATALRHVNDLLEALEAAHSAGIIHRDVKPQNLLLSDHGEALLADFGVALITQSDHRQTRTGIAIGSMSFMAPEQRLDARSVGPTADVYGAAATLYALLTHGNPIDLFTVDKSSPRLSMLPEPLLDIVWRGTRYHPVERFPSAAAMREQVQRALETATEERLVAAIPMAPPGAEPTAEASPPHTITLLPNRKSPQSPAPTAARPSRWWLGVALLLLPALWFARPDASTRAATVDAPPGTEATTSIDAPEADSPGQPEGIGEALGEALSEAVGEAVGGTDGATEAPTADMGANSRVPSAMAASPPGHSAVDGSWSGSWDGRPLTLSLRGPAHKLSGEVGVRFLSNTVRSQVRGAYDSATRTLTLQDVEPTSDAGTYTATLSADGDRLAGRFSGQYNGRIVQFSMRRP